VRNLLLPVSEKRKQFELRALGLRDFAGVTEDQALDPFALASFAGLLVIDFESIEGLSAESRAHLLGAAADEWSGGACSRPLPDGRRLVILNPEHGIQRNRATLMEEVAHVFLGHKANRLAVLAGEISSSSFEQKRLLARDYNQADEEAAYAVGAAALVPFGSLQRRVKLGRSAVEIARHFRVSRQLVEYRIKVTQLWPLYKRTSTESSEHV